MKYILFFKSVYVYFKHILSLKKKKHQYAVTRLVKFIFEEHTTSIRSYFFTNYIYEPRARKKKTEQLFNGSNRIYIRIFGDDLTFSYSLLSQWSLMELLSTSCHFYSNMDIPISLHISLQGRVCILILSVPISLVSNSYSHLRIIGCPRRSK